MIYINIRRRFLIMRNSAHCRACRSFPFGSQAFFDFILFGIRQLETSLREKLDSVVRHRIVRSRNNRAYFNIQNGSQKSDARSGNNARINNVKTAGRHSRLKRSSQKVAGNTRIAPDNNSPSSFAAVFGKHAHRRVPHFQSQLRGQLAVCQTSYAVRTEQLRHIHLPSIRF